MKLPSDRQTLVHNNKDLPELVAARYIRKYPELADQLLSIGNAALVEAGRTYDARRGPLFRPYAMWRVTCAIRSCATRDVVRRHPGWIAVDQADAAEMDGPAREPADADAIERTMGDTEEHAKERAIAWARGCATRNIVAFLFRAEQKIQAYPRGGDAEMIARQEYGRGFAELAKAFAILPDAKRQVLIRHYVQDKSLRKIALADGLDVKTVQDIHTDALKQLESELRKHEVNGAPSIEGRPSGFELGAYSVIGADESKEPKARVS